MNRPTILLSARSLTTMIAAMLVMFLLGAVYAYGILLPAIMTTFHWRNAEAILPQSVLLFVYAIGMGLGGVLQDRIGPTRIAMFGSILFGLGLLFAGRATTLLGFTVSYGILGGIGFGCAYVSAVTAAMRSFPHRRGLAAGLVVGAFGIGSAVWAPLAQHVLDTRGWQEILSIYGAIALIALPFLSLGIRPPRAVQLISDGNLATSGMTLGESLRTPIFWVIFLAYLCVTSAGLMWLNHYKLFGISQGMTAAYASWLVAITAIGSGTGRVGIGGLSDSLGRFRSLIGATLIGMVLFILLAFGLPHLGIFVVAGFVGIVFGAWLALYGPTATDLFGMKAAGAIYGALYLSYGFGGLLGPTLGGYLAEHHHGSYRLAFFTAALLCLLGTILFGVAQRLERFVFRHPPAREEEYPLE